MSAKEEALRNIDAEKLLDWVELKKQGSEHYKTDGGVQPIDLYKSMGIFRGFAIASIIKYAARNAGTGRPEDNPVSVKDMTKIKHYADLLMAACGGE
jgi:hypothetical protein